MRYVNEEVRKLLEEVKPWRENEGFKKNTPQRIKDMYEKAKRLADEDEERLINIWQS